MDTINEVSDHSFQAEVIESDRPVVVDFWAPWCAPCRAVSPILQELAGARDDVKVVKLNIDDNQQVAAQFGILSLPTMIVFKNGGEAHRVVGAYPKLKLLSEIEPQLA